MLCSALLRSMLKLVAFFFCLFLNFFRFVVLCCVGFVRLLLFSSLGCRCMWFFIECFLFARHVDAYVPHSWIKKKPNTQPPISFSLRQIKFSAQFLPCVLSLFAVFSSAFSMHFIMKCIFRPDDMHAYRRAYFSLCSSALLFSSCRSIHTHTHTRTHGLYCLHLDCVYWNAVYVFLSVCVYVYLMRSAHRNHVIFAVGNTSVYLK